MGDVFQNTQWNCKFINKKFRNDQTNKHSDANLLFLYGSDSVSHFMPVIVNSNSIHDSSGPSAYSQSLDAACLDTIFDDNSMGFWSDFCISKCSIP